MALPLTALRPDYTRRRKINRLKSTPTGNYVTGGVPFDLSSIANPNWFPNVGFGSVPNIDDITVTKVPGGYTAEIVSSGVGSPTLATAYLMKVYTTAGTELAAAAFPAALLAGVFEFEINVNIFTQ